MANIDDSPEAWAAASDALNKRTQAVQVSNSLYNAATVNPDQAARNNVISRFTKIPVTAVESFPEDAQRQYKMATTDARALVEKSPILSRFLAVQDTANVVHDDLANATQIEQSVKTLGSPVMSAWDGTPEGETFREKLSNWWRDKFGAMSVQEERRYRSEAEAAAILASKKPGMSDDQAWEASRQAIGGMSPIPQIGAERFVDSASFGVAAPTIPSKAHSWQASVGAGLGQLGGFIVGPAKGAGALISPLEHVAGESFAKAIVKDVVNQAATLALASAAEKGGHAVLDSHNFDEAAQKEADALQGGATTGAIFGAAGRVLPDNTVLQAALRAVGVNTATSLVDGTTPWDESVPLEDRVFNVVLNSLFSLHGAGRVEGGWLRDATRAKIADEAAQKLSDYADTAAASKWRQRDVQTFREFVADATDGAPIDSVYVDASAFDNALHQSKTSDVDLWATMPQVAKQLTEARESNGQVQIPLADFSAHIAGTDLQPLLIDHLRTDPEGMTKAEADAFYQSQHEQLGGELAKSIADAGGDHSAAKVEAHILDQLSKANRFTPEVNKAYASVMGAFYRTQAERAGLSAEDFYQQNPVTISAESLMDAPLGDKRGAYIPSQSSIHLFQGADLSTFLHEAGHHFLEVLTHVAHRGEAHPQLKADAAILLRELGVKDLQTWHELDTKDQTAAHERFAEGFERYLLEGKAPSVGLQAVFSRFRTWLLHLYRSIQGKADISDEVRGVMDRMLASDAEIRMAQDTRGMSPLFKEKPAGVTADEFREYQALGQEATQSALETLSARSVRDVKWLSGAKARALKEMQAQADGYRKEIRRDVAKEVEQQPVYRAETFLRNGETVAPDGERIKALEGHKLDIDLVRKLAPEGELGAVDWQKLGTGKHGMLGKDGLDPQLVAEMFGFDNATALVHSLIAAPKRGEVIDALTDQRMLERHGELTTPHALENAVNLAVHNEARARFVATELKALTKAVGPARIIARAAKEAADAAIAVRRVGSIKPSQYSAAEAKNARQAEKLLAASDVAGAAKAKRAQLLSNQLAKAAGEALEDVNKGLRYLKRFDKLSVLEAIDVEYRDQIVAMLERYDLRSSISGKELEKRRSLLDWAQAQYDAGYNPAIPDYLLDEARSQHYKDLTVEQFRGLVDAVKSIEHLGKLKQTLIDNGKARDFNAVVDEAVANLQQQPQRAPDSNRGIRGIESKWLNLKSQIRSADASLLKMEQVTDWLDAHDSNGVFNRVVFRRIADAGGKENDLRQELAGKMRALSESMPKEFNEGLSVRFTVPELRDAKTGKASSLLKSEILAIALNTGNESNLHKLLEGEGWSEHALRAALDRHMTKADWDFVQGVWDTVESLWPQIEAMERRLGNTSPPKVEAREFVTPHGTYRGGYYPVVYDPLRSYDAEQNRQRGDQLFENNYTRATTPKGHTIARVDGYARPLLLSLDVLPRHLNQVAHDLAYREAIIDADRFLSDKRVREAVEGALGREYYLQFRPWLQAIANEKAYDARGLAFWDKAAHSARTSATLVGLGYRLSTMLIHGATAGANSIGEIGVKDFAKGLAATYTPKSIRQAIKAIGPEWMKAGADAVFGDIKKFSQARDFVFERSAEMRHRMNEVDRDVREAIRGLETKGKLSPMDTVRRFAYYGIAMLDMGSALPTWMGAYNKALREGMTEDRAVYAADKAVRNAHGGTGAKDLSAIQRGSEFQKLFTMFYSFWNHFYNRQRDIARSIGQLPTTFRDEGVKAGAHDTAMVLARSWWYFIIPQLIHAALKPPASNQEQPGNWATWAAEEIALGLFSGIPVVRDIANAAATGRDYNATPAASIVVNLSKSAKDARDAIEGEPVSRRWIDHAGNTAGYVFGLPIGQASTSLHFLWDVWNGEQRPEDLAGWWKGISHGRSDEQHG